MFALGELAKRYDVGFAREQDFVDALKQDDRFVVRDGPEHHVQSHVVNITDSGRQWVEDEIGGDNIATHLEQNGISYSAAREEREGASRRFQDNSPASIEALETYTDRVSPAVESSRWTGIENRLQTRPDLVDIITSKIHEIDDIIEKTGLTNAEKDKAKRITASLILLVESPEPEWKAIVELLNSKNLTAMLNIYQIVQVICSIIFGK
ncbi:hypothetical protein [Sphingosinicella microcystinivorans]|nr:hypothetical protein [Sphingosinicella microcystinivorans]